MAEIMIQANNNHTGTVVKKLLLIFLIVAGLYFAKDFLMPLAIGGVIATLLWPLCVRMERKMKKGLAVLICLLIILAGISGIGLLLTWQISELSDNFSQIKEKFSEAVTKIQDYLSETLGINEKKQKQFLDEGQSNLGNIMKTILGSLAYVLTNLLFILAYTFLLLYYRVHLKEFILRLFPVSQRKEMEFIIDGAGKVSQQYLVGLAKMIGCLWVLYGIGFSICKVPNAIFFAILCGFLEIVPFVGNITGTSITLLVSAMHGAESMTLIGIVIVYGVVQFVQGWLIEPLVLGRQVKINPLMTVVVLVIGELVWGIPGIFLAIPLSAMLKTVCDHVEPLKPLGFLLGKADTRQEEKK